MVEGKWVYQIPLLIFLVITLHLMDCKCNVTTESHLQNVASTLKPGELNQPKLLIFSLDLVIWPFRVDHDVVTPVKKIKRTGQVKDFIMKPLGVYSDARDALNTLYLKKYRMAAISDSPDLQTITKLLLYFNLYHFFPIQEIFGGPKKDHLEVIHRTTHIPYQEIFYFDVENDQLDGMRKLGVQVIEVSDGLWMQDFNRALEIYNNGARTSTLATSVL